MVNPEHLAILEKGVEVWNKWLEENPDIIPDLSEADLTGAYVRFADLRGANIHDANLHGAWLNNANLCHSDLSRAKLV